jgi:hypothetical protein
MMKLLITGIGVCVIALGLITSPALAFQCPGLIKQADEAMAKMKADDAKIKQAKDLVAEAQRLHNAGQHAESVSKANEALVLLGVKAGSKPPARKGYSY